ncbi:MAG: molybdopterin oxidoreductase family protein, partial [Gammaproteobacteria bacterium]|nr:molybdopterin oxidoreductase family protein [Gammaproteobacteria bacterium]
VGEIILPAEITDTMMPGVISIPHGFGHNKKGTRVSIAQSKPGVSINDITDPMRVDKLTGNAAFSGLEVIVEKISGDNVSAETKKQGK